MKRLRSDGIELAYLDAAATGDPREPVVLLHALAASSRANWVDTLWVKALTAAGHRVVAPDARGHGESDKPRLDGAYRPEHLVGDVVRLLDELALARVAVVGYSLGAAIALRLAATRPERVSRLVLGGVGAALTAAPDATGALVRALEADAPDAIDDPVARMLRTFADRSGGDRLAFAACVRAVGLRLPRADLCAIEAPTLVIAGADDRLAGDPRRLAAMVPDAAAVVLPGRDHVTAIGDPAHRRAVVRFLSTI